MKWFIILTSMIYLCAYTVRDEDLKVQNGLVSSVERLAGAIQQLRDRVADLEKSCH